MKKFIIGFILGAIILGGTATLASTPNTFTATIATFPVLVNGQQFRGTTGEVMVIDGRTYLPLRDMGNALGVSVEWNAALGRVEVVSGTSSQDSQGQGVTSSSAGRTLADVNREYAQRFRVEIQKAIDEGWIVFTPFPDGKIYEIVTDEGAIEVALHLSGDFRIHALEESIERQQTHIDDPTLRQIADAPQHLFDELERSKALLELATVLTPIANEFEEAKRSLWE